MEIGYDRLELREYCENLERADSFMGRASAELFRDRLADLAAAPTIKDLVIVGLIETRGDIFVSAVGANWELVFRANNNPPPTSNGVLDWNRVSRICILDIRRIDVI